MKKCLLYLVAFGLLAMLSGCVSPLHTASGRGDIETVEELLDQGADVNAKQDIVGWTALMWAAAKGQTETAKLLIDKGADVEAKAIADLTALMTAAASGHTEAAKLLIDKGADVNAKRKDGSTALIIAAASGHTETAKLLIDKGADMEANASVQVGYFEGVRDGMTALIYAAWNGHTEVARLLLDKGADIEAKDEGGWTALTWAVYDGHTEVARLLLDKGADIEANGGTALMMAAYYGHTEIAKLLRENQKQAAVSSAPQSISKEDLKAIVQAAVEGASQAQKTETRAAPVRTDIASPSFGPSETVMTENDLAVIIGIEGYQSLPKSDYSYDDAVLVKEYAKALGFKERNIEILGDERATKSGIEKTIEAWLVNKAKPGSRVFVYYSGHGAPDPATGDAYLVPYDGDPNYLAQTGYPLKRLYASLGKLPASEVVVVLDACFSGAGGRSVIAKGARPMMVTAEKLSVPQNMVVLSSTQGAQISTSSPEKGHGVFTYYFLKALREGRKNASEIYDYVKPMVEDEAKQLNVQQSPSMMPQSGAAKGRFSLRR